MIRRQTLSAALAVAGIVLLTAAITPAASLANAPAGAAFVQTNDPAGNSIVAYTRASDGSLTRAGTYATGGNGATQSGAPTDPLASQGSLVLDGRHSTLYAVNAGSDTVSVFRVRGSVLRLRQVVPSGGSFPTSVAVADRLVYVLNAGGPGTISGYRTHRGRLHPIRDSIRELGLGNATPPFFLSSPAQIGFTPDRRQLLVSTKNHGFVDSFAISDSGRPASAPVSTPTGPVPFAFVFDPRGRLVLTDASGSANTYRVDASGALSPIGAPAPNGQTATCWLVAARRFYYATNTGSNTITGYSERRGQLSLLEPDGVSATTDPGPIDIAASPDGRFVYELNGLAGTLGIYATGRDGSLTRRGTVTGLPAFNGSSGMEGLVVG
jgi:6-phosphogluconolactonase (cycloisomerase 2 family)